MSISPLDLDNIVDILGLPDGTIITVEGLEEAGGFSDDSLAGFSGSTEDPFLVVSTGRASDANGANTGIGQGTDLGASGVSDDSLILRFTIPKPSDAVSVAFDFTFLSEEFPSDNNFFNDFLSVRLDGTEVALDTSGNPITVNNNFFDSSLDASGTIFDGQTPPLRISAPLSQTSDTFNLEIEIADVGDGVFDSAAFIGNFELVEPQIFFVDFNGGAIEFLPEIFTLSGGITLPASNISPAEQSQIIEDANDIYSDFLVEFTNIRPASGEFSTIFVGGDDGDVPSLIDPTEPGALFGLAEQLDFGNEDKSDSAFVLSDQPLFDTSDGDNDVPLLSQVIAHEAGHLLGLRHVEDDNELLFPIPEADRTNISDSPIPFAERDGDELILIGGEQDSREELIRNVGLRDSSEFIVVDSLLDDTVRFFEFNSSNNGNESPDDSPNNIIGTGADETINGLGGNDTINGGGGNDSVIGGDGDDIISGVNPASNLPGTNEIDILQGGAGADLFELGDADDFFYNDGQDIATNDIPTGVSDYGLIEDFAIDSDLIQLNGSSDQYILLEARDFFNTSQLPDGTSIYRLTPAAFASPLREPSGRPAESFPLSELDGVELGGIINTDGLIVDPNPASPESFIELVAVVQDIDPSQLSLDNSSQFTFV